MFYRRLRLRAKRLALVQLLHAALQHKALIDDRRVLTYERVRVHFRDLPRGLRAFPNKLRVRFAFGVNGHVQKIEVKYKSRARSNDVPDN